MNKIIEVHHLMKTYDDITAVNDISFDVLEGEFFAFLGTNGAGKSTTIDILTTLLKPTSGTVYIDQLELGQHDYDIRKRIGAVFQTSVLDENLTVLENMWIRGGLYGFTKKELEKRIQEVLTLTECQNFKNQKIGELSGGQKRRVDIARSLLHMPKILYLDEPTSGLDPHSRKQIWSTIQKMQSQKGTTIFLTTHYMEEASEASRIAIIDKGKMKEIGTPLQLKEKYSYDILKIYYPSDSFLTLLKNQHDIIKEENDCYEIKIDNVKECIHFLHQYQDEFETFEVIKGSIDDVFLNIITTKQNKGGQQ